MGNDPSALNESWHPQTKAEAQIHSSWLRFLGIHRRQDQSPGRGWGPWLFLGK